MAAYPGTRAARLSFVPLAIFVISLIAAGTAGVQASSHRAADDGDEFIAMGQVCQYKSQRPQLWVGADDLMTPTSCDGVHLVGWDWSKVTGEDTHGPVRWGDFVVVGTYDKSKREMTVTRTAVSSRDYKGDRFDGEDVEETSSTPCKKPEGGWRVLNAASTTQESLDETVLLVEARRDYGSVWLDHSPNPVQEIKTDADELLVNDPTKLILNVSVAGDPALAELDIRKTWGGALCVSRQEHAYRELQEIADAVSDHPDHLMSGVSHDSVDLTIVFDDGSLQSRLDERYGAGMVNVISAIRPLHE